MKPLLIERRTFLAGAGVAWLGSLAPAAAERLAGSDILFAAAYRDAQDGYGMAILDDKAEIVSAHALPSRGHGFATHPDADWLVAFARRPGNFAVALPRQRTGQPVVFHTPPDRHFYGHGAFSADGRILCAAENAFETGDGVIGLYDATDGFSRLGEFASHGVGPHEIILMPDGKTLCVANGGIRTHPDQGRQKLNLPTMAPSIAFIEMATGTLLASHALPANLHRLSLRHMAVDGRGQVWIGGQYEGDVMDEIPVLAKLSADRGLVPVDLPGDGAIALGKYAGSVAISRDGATLAVASPKRGAVVLLDTLTGKVRSVEMKPGTCGVQACGDGFVSSSETGRFGSRHHNVAWDNHIAALLVAPS
ncbi:DUF1513 domain-containing protein [Hoeflea sp. YIM 152468]|uniref:DUF1513 domain-containing protein n=1 Tax=Hoeflea sp. YIM 152468 TaxID=3031759 RepID=UPI0023DB9050|nr:DUF1513 domain-containing protein [Hoeflea sp. YIM 152468]MDF1609076.1 DUF1513 domain-containing protein [Hoeflea sp. YIM 152468]